MRSELLLIEKIEQYLDGTLSSSEHAAFEKEMAANIELQNEVSLQKELMSGLQRSAIKKDVAVAFVKYKKIAFLIKLGMIGASAVVGIAVTIAIVNYTNKEHLGSTVNNNKSGVEFVQKDSISLKNKDSIFVENVSSSSSEEFSNSEPSKQTSLLDYTSGNLSEQTKGSTTEAEKKSTIEYSSVPTVASDQAAKEITPMTPNITADTAAPKAVVPSVAKTTKEKKTNKDKKDTQLSDLFWTQGTTITWLGLDFTNTRLLGKFSELSDAAMKDSIKAATKHFQAWNDLIFKEKAKYSFNDALYTKNVHYYMEHINKRNDTIKAQRLFVANMADLNHLNPNSIQKIVNSYQLEGKEGLGMVFIVESLDKLKQNKSAVWVTIIDMKTNEVLLTEKMTANPGGQGLRNYWARSFYNTIKDIEAKKYPEWKKKYKKS